MQYQKYQSVQPVPITMPFLGREELCIAYVDGAEYIHKLTQSFITVGRDGDHAIVLADPEVSRDHLRLERKNGSWYVTDLGSTNGTILNNSLLPPHIPFEILPDSLLEIGSYRLLLRHSPSSSAEMFGHLNSSTRVKQRLHSRYAASLVPHSLDQDGQFSLTLHNESDDTQCYDVNIQSDLISTKWKTEIPAHQEDQLALEIPTPKRPLYGATRSYLIVFQINTPNGSPRILEGEVIVRPIFDLEPLKKLLTLFLANWL